ncbi:hypothetical protein FOCC_FOCC015219 [Frankliniella occidentalis]|nr:hypothetical protein FOCC_FOCC015219 [Frankliniella occidentalis]
MQVLVKMVANEVRCSSVIWQRKIIQPASLSAVKFITRKCSVLCKYITINNNINNIPYISTSASRHMGMASRSSAAVKNVILASKFSFTWCESSISNSTFLLV